MPSVTTPHSYFRDERDRNYADWRLAFARELIQNSQDAGATQMVARFTDLPGFGRVEFADDGRGMTLADLQTGFFELGGSTKRGVDGQTGGFGRARELVCFGQRAYRIRTRDLQVDGEGGEYEVTDGLPYVQGARFTIDLDDLDCDLVKAGFDDLLDLCALHVPLVVDGREVASSPMPDRARRVLRDDDGRKWAKVYVDDRRRDPFRAQLIVRVRGLAMFTSRVYGPTDIIVELHPPRSRDLLTTNRDGLKVEFRHQLEEFISDLAQNRRRALRPQARPLNAHVSGGGFLATNAYEPPPARDDDRTDDTTSVSGGGSQPDEREPAPAGSDQGHSGLAVPLVASNDAARQAAHGNSRAGASPSGVRRSPVDDRADLPFDVFMLADTNDGRVRKLARQWNPAGWDNSTGRNRRKLIVAWQAAVATVMDELVKLAPGLTQVLWTVGWVFDEDAQALCRKVGEGYILALNPVDDEGRTRFRLNDAADRRRLLALAKHEVCHVVYIDAHHEPLAALMTDVDAAVDPVAADRTIRAAFKAA